MTIRTSPIRRLKSLILALLLLALPIIAAAQGDSSAKPVIAFAVIGDTGTGDEAQLSVAPQMARQREKTPFEFVLMLGDNIYEKGEEKYIKPRFEEPYKDLLEAGVKFYAALGNHDIIRGAGVSTNYANFNMGGQPITTSPKPLAENYENLLEFFALDSNEMTPEQLKWLDEEFERVKPAGRSPSRTTRFTLRRGCTASTPSCARSSNRSTLSTASLRSSPATRTAMSVSSPRKAFTTSPRARAAKSNAKRWIEPPRISPRARTRKTRF